MAFVPMALDVYGTIGPSTRRALQSFAQVIAVKRGTNVHGELKDIITTLCSRALQTTAVAINIRYMIP